MQLFQYFHLTRIGFIFENEEPKGVVIDGVNTTSFRVSFRDQLETEALAVLKFQWRVDALWRNAHL